MQIIGPHGVSTGEPDIESISLSRPPTDALLKTMQKTADEKGSLRIFIDYDFFPTSAGELDLDYLSNFPETISLHLRYVAGLRSLDFVRYLPNLQFLSIAPTRTTKLSLKPLTELTKLRSLRLDKQSHDLSIIGELRPLEYLSLQSISVSDLCFIGNLTNLLAFRLALGGTTDLRFLSRSRIKYLELWQIKSLRDEHLAAIAEAKHLEFLFLDRLKNISQLPELTKLSHLRRIELEGMNGLTDLSVLNSAPSLEELIITDASKLSIDMFRILKLNKTLKRARVGTGSKLKNDEIESLLNLPLPEPPFEFGGAEQ